LNSGEKEGCENKGWIRKEGNKDEGYREMKNTRNLMRRREKDGR